MDIYLQTVNNIKANFSKDIYILLTQNDNIEDTLSAIEDIKETLTDNNYLILMNSLKKSYKSINRSRLNGLNRIDISESTNRYTIYGERVIPPRIFRY